MKNDMELQDTIAAIDDAAATLTTSSGVRILLNPYDRPVARKWAVGDIVNVLPCGSSLQVRVTVEGKGAAFGTVVYDGHPTPPAP
jgi:hypothetical protein